MFDNLDWYEIGALLLLALLIFGDRLPKVIGDGLRMLRQLRRMATNATSDLSRELGTDLKLEDLHPKTFVRKHLLSEEEQEALRKPLQGVFDTVRSDLDGVKSELTGVKSELSGAANALRRPGLADRGPATDATRPTGPSGATPSGGAAPATRSVGYDLDAT
ncbi:MAG TPA: preprotein translocase subunit TatB [Pilimelia sp.]|nr:preprotein translocase subunit TatB [Pilimelia sp.]